MKASDRSTLAKSLLLFFSGAISVLAYARDREAWTSRAQAFVEGGEPNAYYDSFFRR